MARILTLLASILLTSAAISVADLPLGHADFMPTPSRPIGWRGDGNGLFPAATPVTDWNITTGSNVVWRTRLPWFSCSGPIVVGNRVFTTAEPDRLICVDAGTGKVLWERHNHPGMEKLSEAKQKELYALTDRLLDLREHIQRWTAFMDEGARDPQAAAALAAKSPRNPDTVKAVSQLAGGDGGGYFKQNEAGITQYIADQADAIAAIVGTADLREIRKLHARVSKSAWDVAKQKGLSLEEMADAAKRAVTARDIPPNEVDLIDNAWWNSFGNTFPTPASDGTFVVSKMGRTDAWNRLVCYDLDGNRQWAVTLGNEGCWHAAVSSPVICDGLVISHDTRETIRPDGKKGKKENCLAAFDVKTGERRWISDSVDPSTQSPLVIRLNDIPVVVRQKAFRVKDGKCVAAAIAGTNTEGVVFTLDNDFDTPVWDGKDTLFCTARSSAIKDQRDGPRAGWRLRWKDAETLEAELVFHEVDRKGLGWVRGSIVHRDGLLYRHNGAGGRNLMKGVVMKDRTYFSRRSENPEWHVAGPKPLGQGWPNEDNMSAVFGGAYYFGCLTRNPSQMLVATPGPAPTTVGEPVLDGPMTGHIWFQGARMYLRTYRFLYCVGEK